LVLPEELLPAVPEEALKPRSTKREQAPKLPEDVMEAAKATFISSGGNIAQVSALHDLTPAEVARLAHENQWPVYGGGTVSIEKQNRAHLTSLHTKLWLNIEKMLDSMEVEKKHKQDIVQHRMGSRYIEPLASRSAAFKTLIDQYMRVGAMLYPELYGLDPQGSNTVARQVRAGGHPDAIGGVEGVNREIADFLGRVAVGMADELRSRDLETNTVDGYIIDSEVVS
jgi:hypothetical protein